MLNDKKNEGEADDNCRKDKFCDDRGNNREE